MAQYPKRRDIGRHGLAGTPAKSNLEQFKSQFATSDLARTERFECEFHFPSGIVNSDEKQQSMIACEEVQIPGMVLQNKEMPIGSWTFYRNNNMGFLGNEINFTFLTDNNWELSGIFERWIDLCVGTTSKEIEFPDNCHGIIDIKTIDRQDNVTAYWKLYECMPRVLNLIPMGAGNVGVARTSMIVTSAYWESLDVAVELGTLSSTPTSKPKNEAVSKSPHRDHVGRTIDT